MQSESKYGRRIGSFICSQMANEDLYDRYYDAVAADYSALLLIVEMFQITFSIITYLNYFAGREFGLSLSIFPWKIQC